MLGARRGESGLLGMDGAAELHALGALPCGLYVRANTLKLALANGKFQTKTCKFALYVTVTVRGGDDFALDFTLLRVDFFKRFFSGQQLGGNRLERGLLLAHLVLELEDFCIESAKLALHAQGTDLIRAAASDHAALVASAVGRDEGILRIVPRHLFRRGGAVRQIRGAQPRQELLGRGAQRIAEFHELIEARDDAVFRAEIDDGLVFGRKAQ